MFKRASTMAGFLILMVGVTIAMILDTGVSSAEQKVKDEIMIESKLWETKTYTPAKFTHQKHVEDYKIACQDCHHVYKDGKNVWKEGDHVQRCDDCHTFAKTGKALKDATPEEQKLSLYNAFHDNCRGCHTEHNKEHDTKAAPVRCTECHERLPKD